MLTLRKFLSDMSEIAYSFAMFFGSALAASFVFDLSGTLQLALSWIVIGFVAVNAFATIAGWALARRAVVSDE